MDAVLKDKCGQNYKGICAAYSSTPNINQVIMDKMESITFRDPLGNNFEYIDREGNMGMDVIYLNNDDLTTVSIYWIIDSNCRILVSKDKTKCVFWKKNLYRIMQW